MDGFLHTFLYRAASGDVVAGRLWSSSDGKGRTKYPMVVAAHVTGASIEWIVSNVFPELEQLQKRCQAAADAAQVIGAVDQSRAALRQSLASVQMAGAAELTIPGGMLREVSAGPELGPERAGLFRALYQLEREASGFVMPPPGTRDSKSSTFSLRAHQLRMPRAARADAESILLWSRVMLSVLDPGAPLMLIAPVDHPWTDVIVGEPTGTEMYCIRAALKSVPLTSEIPYTLDETFLQRARAWVESSTPGQDVRVEFAGPRSRKSGSDSNRMRAFVPILLMSLAGLPMGISQDASADTQPTAPAEQRSDIAAAAQPTDPRSRYNLVLGQIKFAMSRPGVDDQQAAALVRGFINDVRGLPGGVAYLGSVSELLNALEAELSGASVASVPQAALEVGPASTGLYKSVQLGTDGLRFEPTVGIPGLEPIEFLLVDPPPGSSAKRAFYLAATELSVSQAIAAVRSSTVASEFRALVPPVEPRDDFRLGVRTWEWNGAATPLPRVAQRWFGPASLSLSAPLYPSGVVPPSPPQAGSPMNQIPPVAGVLLARAFGCRLPTADEWRAASSAHAGAAEALANRRDKAWGLQQAHVEKFAAVGRILPSSNVGALGASSEQAAEGLLSSRIIDQDDGVLWLSPAQAGDRPRFQNLVGNVFEMVLDVPPETPWPAATALECEKFVAAHAEELHAIGASAFSGPEIDAHRVIPIANDDFRVGASDLGLRLAFTAASRVATQSLSQRLARRVETATLLPVR